MCVLYTYDKHEDKPMVAKHIYSGWPLREYSNKNPLISLCVHINFNYTWNNTLDINIECSFWDHQDNMKEIFQTYLKKLKTQLLKTSGETVKLC